MYIVLAWLLLNALFPIILRSIERLYQKQIDFLVGKSFYYLKKASFESCRLLLIVIFLPHIFYIKILEKVYPKIFEQTRMENIRFFVNSILDKEFPENYIRVYKMSKGEKEGQ